MVLGNGSTFPKHILYLFYPKYSGCDVHYKIAFFVGKNCVKTQFSYGIFSATPTRFLQYNFFLKSAKAKIIVIFLCFMA